MPELDTLRGIAVLGVLLHHGFYPDAFATQGREHCPDTVVAPGALVQQLAEAGLLAYAELQNVLAAWRAPERCLASPAWQHSNASLTDVHIFGETALIGSRRGADGLAVPLPLHAVTAPSGSANAVPVAKLARTAAGTLSLRGPMVPQHPFPPGAERLGPHDVPGWVVPAQRDEPGGAAGQGQDHLGAVHIRYAIRCGTGRHRGQAGDVLAGQPAQLVELVHAHVDRDPAAVRPEVRRRRPLVPLVAGDQVDDPEVAVRAPVVQLMYRRNAPSRGSSHRR